MSNILHVAEGSDVGVAFAGGFLIGMLVGVLGARGRGSRQKSKGLAGTSWIVKRPDGMSLARNISDRARPPAVHCDTARVATL
jgi:hypothetical protein